MIHDVISSARFRHHISLRPRWAVRLDDLEQALNFDAPTVLHFSGHGYGAQGICFQGEEGGAAMVSIEELLTGPRSQARRRSAE